MTNHKQSQPHGIEVLEAYAASGIVPTTLGKALEVANTFQMDEHPRANRGGGCLLCGFETWYYEPLTGSQATERLLADHRHQHPRCAGQFAFYGGDL